ncbi:MAG TPA: hypothetical protein DEP66_05930, partial [Acidimicrobiaceae bacterium]|nr:hypothetical protein [Acidimicrobiaceae bacterium]
LLGAVLTAAGTPAGAANSADEVLVTDQLNLPTREFAGATRYHTALALAQRYVDDVAGVTSVIVASGADRSLVDALAAAGLAGAVSAPILLTRPSRLDPGVAGFVRDNGIADVYVLGGPSSVTALVLTQLRAIPSVETVVRLFGDTRYETAVAVAEALPAPGTWCGTSEVSAVLVNGKASADAVTIGPLAYANEVPILLTGADELAAVTAGYLIDDFIEQVVIVGGTSAVSRAVADELGNLGIDVIRIAGATRHETAVAVAEAAAHCSSIGFDVRQVALLNDRSVADGVAAAPVLGHGLGDAGVTPAILVPRYSGLRLPAAISGWLERIPFETAEGLVDLAITAVGGKSVVTQETVNLVKRTASTEELLVATGWTVANVPDDEGNNVVVSVSFSHAVNAAAEGEDGFASSVLNRSNWISVQGALLAGDTIGYDAATRTASLTLRGLTYGTDPEADAVRPGRMFLIVPGRIRGAGSDDRVVEKGALTFTVPAPTG